ncbi:hypothetical protein EJ08DRAFT_513832 [Tothia fuscella]|uniref:K Homology domain-containing protein n=1 Tax=Tothia fuscella TaxID=1048955 RepID=A0A9P4U168_9PEZI|nr:hypothetical protein EJ08DRAFT_513832 [Tothia fuscella]
MASTETTNGSSTGPEAESAAQKLLAKHKEAHPVEVEEVVDEEDIIHPPPSATFSPKDTTESDSPTMSDIAKGKKKVDDAAPSAQKKKAELDLADQDAFPSLGKPSTAFQSTWGAGKANGAKGPNTNGTSATSKPASSAPAYKGPAPVNIPGRHVERISLAPQQIAPRTQLKKPLQEILLDINKRSKANVKAFSGANGNMVFEGTGKPEDVRQALKEIVNQIGTKQSVKVPIPASVRPHIIGRQGATIQAISKQTGAKIQIPKQEDLAAPIDEDDDVMIDVIIEGDALGAEMARREIQRIVSERTANSSLKMRDIPIEYYPFIAGHENSPIHNYDEQALKIQVPHYHTWRGQAPHKDRFAPQPSMPIQISGDREAANDARQAINKFVKDELSKHTAAPTQGMERGRHQFIVGDRGSSAEEFFQKTGCAIVKPPAGDDSDELYIIGPPENIQAGINYAMDLAGKVQSAHFDISKPHNSVRGGGAPHARNMARYFEQRNALQELERLHDSTIVLPADGSTSAEVYAQSYQNAVKTRQEIMNLISAHPPSRFHPMPVDPFFHQQLRQREAPKIRREHGVQIVFPDGHVEQPEILLVYEAPGSPSEYAIPRESPSDADKRQHEQAIQEARKYLEALISSQPAIVSRDVEAQAKYHDKVRKYVDHEQKDLGQGQFPVQLLFGGPTTQRSPSSFSLRGPDNQVTNLDSKLRAFLEQEARDEVERNFTTSFDYPQKFANFLIGKRGENINKLRDDYDVEIQVKDGKVELKGPERKCADCKKDVLAQLRKFEDETTHVIKVKKDYHRDLIGAKGAQVNRLQDRYGVRVNFPRSERPAGDDDATEGSVRNYRQQAPDEVIIKGPKKGADEAREELLNLLQWTMDNSFSGSISIQQSQLPQLIGTQGREIEQLRLATGCQIDTPRGDADKDGRVEIKLKGTKKQVEDAKKILLEKSKTFDETVTKNVEIDRRFHKSLIGPMGANIRKIVVDAGGPDDNRIIAGLVRFPKQGQEENANAIRVQGSKSMVDKIIAALNAQVKDQADQVTQTLEVPTAKHRLLIGRGGESRRNLESKFNVSLDIPRQGATGPAATQIKVTGLPSDVEKCKGHIEELVQDQEGETVEVPRKHHNTISDNGQFFRKLRNDLKVTVDHGGAQPPPRGAAGGAKARGRNVNGGSAPLITDEPDSSAHSWELVDNTDTYTGTDGDSPIPWILRGNRDNVAKAKSQLERALSEASKPSWTGYLILPDAKAHRLIIGPGGSQINSIRQQTGTKVQVPKNGDEGEAVEIVGSKEGCEEARDIILDIVAGGAGAGAGVRRD